MLTVVPDLSASLPADGSSSSLIDQLVRQGARQMLAAALRAEVVAYIGQFADVDGIHLGIRLDEDKLCLLVMIGVRADERKELVALADGYRESAGSWADLLRDCARRGMRAPVLAIGDGALGFWKAAREVFPQARAQRCWFHKIANVLGALPKSAHPGAKKALAEIWNAEDKDHARAAVKAFAAAFAVSSFPAGAIAAALVPGSAGSSGPLPDHHVPGPPLASAFLAFSGLLLLACRMWFELRVAEFDLAAAIQEDAEEDVIGVGRDLGGDLMPGPVAGSGGEGEVVYCLVQGVVATLPCWDECRNSSRAPAGITRVSSSRRGRRRRRLLRSGDRRGCARRIPVS